MSYVEHCDKHGQYHADYICGGCFEELQTQISEFKEERELMEQVITQVRDLSYSMSEAEAVFKGFNAVHALEILDAYRTSKVGGK